VAAIAKESVCDMKNSGTESSDNLSERTFIVSARLARQFEFGDLFVTVRQKRSLWSAPAERSGDGALDEFLSTTLPVFPPTWSAF
jgi:hypothetical protein